MMKINQNIILKAFVFLLCLNLAIMPIFQYKTVKASTFDKVKAFTYATVEILMGLQAVGFISDTTLTPENLTNIYNKADEYLHQNFGTELEYAEALRQVDQLGLDIASGQIFVPGNYSGKLWYSFLNAVVDVVWPNTEYQSASNVLNNYKYYSSVGNYDLYYFNLKYMGKEFYLPRTMWRVDDYDGTQFRLRYPKADGGRYQLSELFAGVNRTTGYVETSGSFYCYMNKDTNELNESTGYFPFTNDFGKAVFASLGITSFKQNVANVQHLNTKTANKIKLPTRLPQTVINNINNYIDNSTENLIIAPTAEELPSLPDNYNPVTDDPPDLPGYEDVTPDQEPTPTPTPEPTPEPTPTPTAPEYDGSHWVNPIGEFIAGLLEFLKSAFVPTLSIDTGPLTNANFDMANKFPFSLPNTFKTLLTTVNAPGKTPVFDMTFDMTKLGFEAPIVWHIDLHEWDTGAEIAKTSLYIIFLLGLILMTKKLFVK